MIKLLLESGADINGKDENDWTPLCRAAYDTKTPEIISLMLDYGADVTARDTAFFSRNLNAVERAENNPHLKEKEVLMRMKTSPKTPSLQTALVEKLPQQKLDTVTQEEQHQKDTATLKQLPTAAQVQQTSDGVQPHQKKKSLSFKERAKRFFLSLVALIIIAHIIDNFLKKEEDPPTYLAVLFLIPLIYCGYQFIALLFGFLGKVFKR